MQWRAVILWIFLSLIVDVGEANKISMKPSDSEENVHALTTLLNSYCFKANQIPTNYILLAQLRYNNQVHMSFSIKLNENNSDFNQTYFFTTETSVHPPPSPLFLIFKGTYF